MTAVPFLQDMGLLEAGCGAGFLTNSLRGKNSSLTGIDYSQHLIDFSKDRDFPGKNLFELANIKDYVPKRNFDLIFMIWVLHHIDVTLPAMKNLVSLLKPGSWLVANEPQPGNPLVHRMRLARKKVKKNDSDEQLEPSFEVMQDLYTNLGLTNIRRLAQGSLSTRIAEAAMRPQFLLAPLSWLACQSDTLLEKLPLDVLRYLCRNGIVAEQKPN